MNGDGKLDIVSTGHRANLVAVRFGLGNGDFSAEATYPVGRKPFTVLIADLSHDGWNDLATANSASANLSVLLNDGTGKFKAQVKYATGASPRIAKAADIDRDGDLDLVAALATSKVSIMKGNGGGTFQAYRQFATGNSPFGLAIADVNHDGKLDLTTPNNRGNYPTLKNPGGDNLSVLIGVGNGTFLAAQSDNPVGQGAFYHAVGDLNCDGAPDAVVPNYWDNTLSVLLNSSGSKVACGETVPIR